MRQYARENWKPIDIISAFRLRGALRRRRHNIDRHQSRSLVAKPALPREPTPGKQLAARQPMPPRRRRNLPTPAKALGDDPPLLLQGPPTSSAGRNDLDARYLRHSRRAVGDAAPTRRRLYVHDAPWSSLIEAWRGHNPDFVNTISLRDDRGLADQATRVSAHPKNLPGPKLVASKS
jgi:hypothetical protein